MTQLCVFVRIASEDTFTNYVKSFIFRTRRKPTVQLTANPRASLPLNSAIVNHKPTPRPRVRGIFFIDWCVFRFLLMHARGTSSTHTDTLAPVGASAVAGAGVMLSVAQATTRN